MSIAVRHTPSFSPEEAVALARRHFGISAAAAPLPGDRDQNLRLDRGGRPAFVLKISNPTEDRAAVEGQHRLLRHLENRMPALGAPRVVMTGSGAELVTVADAAGVPHLVRVLTWVPGSPLADHPPPRPAALLAGLGSFLGGLTVALEGLEEPSARRSFEWDLLHGCETVRGKAAAVDDRPRRARLEAFLHRFESRVSPRLGDLRRSVIHNDANDHNLLVTGGEVSGIIDFGDFVHSVTAGELAVGAAYALLDEPDPLAAAACVIRGFEAVFPLDAGERDVLFELMLMRLAISVSVCAEQKRIQPGNVYLTVSERPAWAALERLATLAPEAARTRLFGGDGA